MSYLKLNLQQSLKGLPFLGNYSGFPLQQNDWSKFITNEQALNLTVYGLKPGTVHKVYLNGVDVTSLCKQEGKQIGTGLITPAYKGVSSSQSLNFVFYFRSGAAAQSAVEYAAAQSILIGGVRTLEIKSLDNTSFATVQLSLPQYAREEPEVIIKKNVSPNPIVKAQTVNYIENTKSGVDSNYYFTPANFSLVQTFYADSDIVSGANEVALTSIDLFFRLKPDTKANLSGNPNAGVAICICEVENDQPILQKSYASSLTYKNYSQIYSFADASTATTFGFSQPVKITTGRFYGIVVIFDDPGYTLWTNKTGDRLVNTNIPSPGVNSNKDGKLFLRNSSGVFNSLSDTDIKFVLRCAQYNTQSEKKTLVNKDYEYFTVTNQVGSFYGGEYVWQNTTPATGTIDVVQGTTQIIGTTTSFSTLNEDSYIVLISGTASQVVAIDRIVNNTHMSVKNLIEFTNTTAKYVSTVVGKVYLQDKVNNKIYLADSTANVIAFSIGSTFIGADSGATANIVSIDNISIDRVRLRGSIKTPVSGTLDVVAKFSSKTDPSTYTYSDANSNKIRINNQQVYNVTKHDAHILSRSNELQQAALFTDTSLLVNRKSIKIEADYANLNANNLYISPQIENSRLDLFSIENRVSNTCDIIANGVVLDSEVNGNGAAIAKHIGVKVQFSNDRFAEDVRMFMVAYRPKGTEIRCYVRLHNSKDPEAFDDKSWTPLEYVQNGARYSSTDDENDFIEYELGLPSFSPASNTIPGTFTTVLDSNTIATANATFSNVVSYVANNDVIRIYNPLFPTTNYQVATITEANTTHIIIGDKIRTTNVAGSGYKIDKVKYPYIAYNNINNTNISRYYNTALAEFDTFDSMQVKIVMLADTTYKVPRIDQIQVLGVSA